MKICQIDLQLKFNREDTFLAAKYSSSISFEATKNQWKRYWYVCKGVQDVSRATCKYKNT